MMQRMMATVGCLILALAWLGPFAFGTPSGFAGRMIVHVAVVAIAAPLLAVGLAGLRFDPTPVVPLLFAPMLATALEFVVVWGWHAPLLHAAARGSPAIFALEQGSFLAVGLLVWLSAFGHGCGPARAAWGAGILALFLTSMHMTLLGALLALSPRPLYGHAHAAGIAGLAPLDDQHLGGAVMLLVGGASYLIGGLVLIARLLRAPDARLAATSGRGR